MGHRRGNFKFLESFSHYMPSVGGMLVLLLFIALGAVIGNVLVAALMLSLGDAFSMEYATLLSYPVMFFPAMIYAIVASRAKRNFTDGISLDAVHFSPSRLLFLAIIAMVLTISASFLSEPLSLILPQMPPSLKELMEGMTSGTFWVNFVCVCVFAPFFEEWLCRGMILRGLVGNGVKPVWAIVISAVFFGLIHLNPWQALPAFVLGCAFGYVYYRTASLKLCMLMHFTNNFMALVLSRVDSLQDMESFSDLIPMPWYALLLAASAVIVVLSLLIFNKIKIGDKGHNFDTVKALFSE